MKCMRARGESSGECAIKHESRLYVYGAQTTAYGIVQALERQGQKVEGYVVTKSEGNPSVIRDKRVWCIDDLPSGEPPTFFLAVPEYLHAEIIDILGSKGFYDYIPMDGDMEYRLMKDYYRARGRLKFMEDYAEDFSEEAVEAVPEKRMEIYVAKSAGDRPLSTDVSFPQNSIDVQAGAALHDRIPTRFRDDTGENISNKNSHYDELTVTYWAWKNSSAGVKGISHYRRCIALTEAEREALVKGRVDALLPMPFLCYPDTGMQYGRYNRPEAVDAMLEAIRIVHGKSMLEKARAVLAGDLLYNYNMLVAAAEVFDRYCAWMFPVLEQVERLRGDLLTAGVHTRICGHLGEILGSIYFLSCGQDLRIIHGKKVWFV